MTGYCRVACGGGWSRSAEYALWVPVATWVALKAAWEGGTGVGKPLRLLVTVQAF